MLAAIYLYLEWAICEISGKNCENSNIIQNVLSDKFLQYDSLRCVLIGDFCVEWDWKQDSSLTWIVHLSKKHSQIHDLKNPGSWDHGSIKSES